MDLASILERAGIHLERAIVEKIRSHIPPPLQPETVRRKGSSTPLIDTGQLIGSVTHQIRVSEDRITLHVGIFDPEVLVYAHTHEYGDPTRNIPERSFLRSTFDEEKEQVVKIIREGLKNLEVRL